MRNMVRVLTAGALVVCLSGALSFADGEALPTFKVTAAQKAGVAGGTVTVQVGLADGVDLAALQFQMKATGGTQGTLKVVDIVMNDGQSDYIFGPSDLHAVDKGEMRAGAVKMNGGETFQSASIATVTLRFSKNAQGTFMVNVVRNQSTFLRDSTAGVVNFAIGKDVPFTVRSSPTGVKKRGGERR